MLLQALQASAVVEEYTHLRPLLPPSHTQPLEQRAESHLAESRECVILACSTLFPTLRSKLYALSSRLPNTVVSSSIFFLSFFCAVANFSTVDCLFLFFFVLLNSDFIVPFFFFVFRFLSSVSDCSFGSFSFSLFSNGFTLSSFRLILLADKALIFHGNFIPCLSWFTFVKYCFQALKVYLLSIVVSLSEEDDYAVTIGLP